VGVDLQESLGSSFSWFSLGLTLISFVTTTLKDCPFNRTNLIALDNSDSGMSILTRVAPSSPIDIADVLFAKLAIKLISISFPVILPYY
jgi:hypothetical protein